MSFAAFTTREEEAINAVLTHQLAFLPIPLPAGPLGTATELHIAVDGGGTTVIDRVVHPAIGGELTDKMKAAAATAAGCRIIHNHPSQHSLSHSDWGVLAAHPSMEMTAVNSHGTTFRGKVLAPDAFPDWATAMFDLATLVENRLATQIGSWASQQLWDVVDVAANETWITGWAIGDRLQDKGFALFECVPAGAQTAACAGSAASTFRAALDRICIAELP